MRVTQEEKEKLKYTCLHALINGFKGFFFTVPYDSKKNYAVKIDDIADFMVSRMVESIK